MLQSTLHPRGGGGGGGRGKVNRISREEDNQMGVKNKTQKIPRASNKTPKILDQTLTPPPQKKILCRISKP